MREVNLLGVKSEKRVYREITNEQRRVLCRFGREYYDDADFPGYKGYKYDESWIPVARKMIDFFGLSDGAKILDVGCAKGFLLHDFKLLNPTFRVRGVDISRYAIEHAMPTIKDDLTCCDCVGLPYGDSEFDLVTCMGTLHNLDEPGCRRAIGEINRVGKKHRFVMVHSYRDEEERKNLINWEATLRLLLPVDGWKEMFEEENYRGHFWFKVFV